MIPRVKPEGMLFRKPVSTFRDHALVAQAGSLRDPFRPVTSLVTFLAASRRLWEHWPTRRRPPVARGRMTPSGLA